MGASKSIKFTEEQNKLANMFKALAHPARISILQLLINKQSCVCGDIVDELPLSQSTISQHLNELKKAGIIKGEISGAKTCYCIDKKVWNDLDDLIKQFISSHNYTSECC